MAETLTNTQDKELSFVSANRIYKLINKYKESQEFFALSGSEGLSIEGIEDKMGVFQEIIENIPELPVTTSYPSLDLLWENALLRQEISQIKQKLIELEARIPEEKVITIREITVEQAKKEIRDLFSNGRTLYYSDIAEELGLDLKLVVDVCHELEENGEIGIDEKCR